MIARRIKTRTRRLLRLNRFAQIAFIVLIWAVGEAVSRLFMLPLPGSVIGMLLALMLLFSGVVKPASLQRGSRWFIGDMLLFFVPAVVAVVDHSEFVGLVGLKIISVILCGTMLVMLSTALAVDLGYRLMRKREGQGNDPAF